MPAKTSPRGPSLADLLAEIDVVAALRAIGKPAVDEFVSRAQVAEMFGVTLRTVDKYVARGLLVPLRVPTSRLTRFRKRDVVDLLRPIK